MSKPMMPKAEYDAKEQVQFHGVLMSRELRDYVIRETT